MADCWILSKVELLAVTLACKWILNVLDMWDVFSALNDLKPLGVVGLSSTCNYFDMSSTRENHANVDIKNISQHISTCYSNDIRKYLRDNKIMSKFSRDPNIVVFCRPSFILRSQCALYFWVCSISQLFLCAMNINESQSFQSPHPKVGIASFLYDSATEQLKVFVQNFKSYYVDMSSTCQDFFTDMSIYKKKILDDSPRG